MIITLMKKLSSLLEEGQEVSIRSKYIQWPKTHDPKVIDTAQAIQDLMKVGEDVYVTNMEYSYTSDNFYSRTVK